MTVSLKTSLWQSTTKIWPYRKLRDFSIWLFLSVSQTACKFWLNCILSNFHNVIIYIQHCKQSIYPKTLATPYSNKGHMFGITTSTNLLNFINKIYVQCLFLLKEDIKVNKTVFHKISAMITGVYYWWLLYMTNCFVISILLYRQWMLDNLR